MIENLEMFKNDPLYSIPFWMHPESEDDSNHFCAINENSYQFLSVLLEAGWLYIYRNDLFPSPIAISPRFAKQYNITINSTDEEFSEAFAKHCLSDKKITVTI